MPWRAGAGQQRRRVVDAREERVVLGAQAVEPQVGGGALAAGDACAVWTAWTKGSVCAVSSSDSVAGRGASTVTPGVSSQPSADKQRHGEVVTAGLERMLVAETVRSQGRTVDDDDGLHGVRRMAAPVHKAPPLPWPGPPAAGSTIPALADDDGRRG